VKVGQIYFLRRRDGLVKVGFTTNLPRRIASLSRSHGPLDVIRVINGDRRRENAIHGALRPSNEFGEWFRDSDELRAFIAQADAGEQVGIEADDVEREWRLGEEEQAREAAEIVAKLIMHRRQRKGCNNVQAMDSLAQDYRLRRWFIRHLQTGKPLTVTAYGMKRLREALLSELTAHRDDMLRELKEIDDADEARRVRQMARAS
jgi:hypothetical protein